MLSVEGYSVEHRIHGSENSAVYTGSRASDGLAVVFKVYLGAASGASRRAQREFELLEKIEHAGVVRPVEVRTHAGRQVLVLERFPGQPLSRHLRGQRLDSATFLGIAIAATHAVAAVHEARIIHKDIKPGNLLIDPDGLRVCLIDFGISAEYGRAERAARTREAEGTAFYMAPEQTGRTGLGIDFRTDLYSLGATFHELLTGQPPFVGASPGEVVAAHIAQRPRSAIEVERCVPLTLSRIIDKLLEKDPELRYQTARGLAADLERCKKQLSAEGQIDDDLVLGEMDGSDRLRFPHRLYGRQRERAALEAALERVSERQRPGGPVRSAELALISGPPGIGKSTLAGVMREPIARAGGYLAEAKFDPDRQDRPYAGFQAALDALIEQLLVDRPERIEYWSTLLRAELGSIGGALVEIVPLVGALVSDLGLVPSLSGEAARERLALAVVRFVRAVARPAHPLVLFLDDLQWADAGSLFLLRALLLAEEPGALLVIGGYRDAEVGPAHPFARLLAELRGGAVPILELPLDPLGLRETTALLADALGRSPEDTEWLARCVGPKSQHNPLLLRRLMFHLWDRDLIRYQHGIGWVWDPRGLSEADITDDVAAMVAARIDALPGSWLRLLRIASLVGRTFETETVVELAAADRLDVLQALMALVEQGLLAPCPEGFKFTHDRLREAAQSGFGEQERSALHHRAARLLLERTPADQLPSVCFQLAEQLAGAIDLLNEAERSRAIEIFRLTSARALEKGSAETADHYTRLAGPLLRAEDWRDRFELAYDLCMLGVDAATQTFDEDRALAILDDLERRPMTPLHRARVLEKRIHVYSLFRPDEAADLGLRALRSYGVRMPARPSALRVRLDILRTDWMLRGPGDDRMFPAPRTSDMSWLGPILILRGASAAIFHRSTRLSCLCMGYGLRTYRRHGFAYPSTALASYAATRPLVQRDLRGVAWYARVAKHFLARETDPRNASLTEILLAFVESWLGPRRTSVALFERVAVRARELGQIELCGYALLQQASFSALSGDPLDDVRARAARMESPRRRSELTELSELYDLVYGYLAAPRGAGLDVARVRRVLDELSGRRGIDVHIGVHLAAALCVLGDHRTAADEIERLWPRVVSASQNGSARVDYVLYRGLCQAALAESEPRTSSRRTRHRKLARCLRQLRAWAREGHDFVHMVRLLEAETQRSRNRTAAALHAYAEAARLAESGGYVHHAALSHERRASLLDRAGRTTEASSALALAQRLYRRWGATAKVAQLDPRLAPVPDPRPRPPRAL